MITNTAKPIWIRRVAAGVFLAVAAALIALGTAGASHADTTGPNFNSPGTYSSPPPPWNHSSWIHRHQDQIQSWYR